MIDPTFVFSVNAGDPNPADHLYIRWISDYPPVSGITRLVWEQDQPNAVGGVEFTYKPNRCEAFSQGSSHRLYVVVSDRPFLDANDPALVNFALPYNQVEGQGTSPLTGSWGIQCQ